MRRGRVGTTRDGECEQLEVCKWTGGPRVMEMVARGYISATGEPGLSYDPEEPEWPGASS